MVTNRGDLAEAAHTSRCVAVGRRDTLESIWSVVVGRFGLDAHLSDLGKRSTENTSEHPRECAGPTPSAARSR